MIYFPETSAEAYQELHTAVVGLIFIDCFIWGLVAQLLAFVI